MPSVNFLKMKKNDTTSTTLGKLGFILIPITVFFILWQVTFTDEWLLVVPIEWRSVPTYKLHPDWFLVHPRTIRSHMSKLPNLTAIEWPVEPVSPYPIGGRTARGRNTPLPRAFEPSMSRGQRRLFRELLKTFSDLMFAHGLGDRFMLYGGTLLGSLRHHDFIPWDDDIDILVDISIRPKLKALMKKLQPAYVFRESKKRDKFHTRIANVTEQTLDVALSRRTSSYSWGWPFVDIGYFNRNSTHIWDIAEAYKRSYVWPVEVVFPLYFRPFGKHWFPAPRDSVKFTLLTYNLSSACRVFGYSHVFERSRRTAFVPCRDLGFRYAFVHHKPCKEQLNQATDSRMSLGEERLIIRTNVTDFAVIHSFCVAVDASNMEVDAYSLSRHPKHPLHMNVF